MMKFKQIKGAIRHSELQETLAEYDLVNEWISFMLGKTMCAMSAEHDINFLSNQGIYPVDIERFCYQH